MLGNSSCPRPLAVLADLDRAAKVPRYSRYSRLARALRERPRLARASGRPRRASKASGLEFPIGGDTGREVHVRGLAPGLTQLRVQIGDAPSDPPQFPLHVVTNRVLHLTAWIVKTQDGGVARSEDQVLEMIASVNDVYAQIGTSFVLDEVIAVTNQLGYNVYRYRETGDFRYWGFGELLAVCPSVSDVNCLFVNSFADTADVLAVHSDGNIVMTRNADSLVLAHELGHRLGASDIYVRGRSGDWRMDAMGRSFSYSCAGDDWSNGCYNAGPGYYERSITCDVVIERLLMNGRGVCGRDITAGAIWGVHKISSDIYETGLIPIGLLP